VFPPFSLSIAIIAVRLFLFFFLYCSRAHLVLHSFPTRRSSDLHRDDGGPAMNAIETRNVSKHFRDVTALEDVSLDLAEGRVHGLLGRNGAGKTTLMKLLTGQRFASSGEMRVLGENPAENARARTQTGAPLESQQYAAGSRPRDGLRLAECLHPAWDHERARELVAEFRLPETRVIKKLSRGQLSAVGIIVGLASRAPLTFFDEPYLGLDAVARRLFFDRLLADFSAHPRTVILSTHHIDEVSDLLEHVVLLDQGRVEISAETDELRSAAIEVSGRLEEVRSFIADADLLHLQELGAL